MAPITLGQNIPSLAAQRRVNQSSAALAASFERLSSGLRINHAGDDAAGLSVSSQLSVRARVFDQAVRNVNDAISVTGIAAGALGSLRDITQRQLELAQEAANGTYSVKQRQALNTEANSLVDEFNRIVSSTSFNGQKLFDTSSGTLQIAAGYGSSGTLTVDLSGVITNAIGNGSFSDSGNVHAGGVDYKLSTTDVNGDGKADIVTVSAAGNELDVTLGNGDGTFLAPVSIQTAGDVFSTTSADLNGDGHIDIITQSIFGNKTLIHFGNGDAHSRPK